MSARAAFWLILLAALALRLAGLLYGLPAVFNSDEPHVVNLAVSFGRGTLKPDLFKYPTLYPYVLFAAFGALFVAWSGFGMRHSVAEFGGYFAWHPMPFYLIGRVISAAASLAAVLPVFRAASTWLGPFGALAAAGLLAVSPVVVESGHFAKPEALMFAWSAAAWGAAAAYLALGRRRDLITAGVFCGLAGATQYSAAPIALMLPAAWLARRLQEGSGRPGDLFLGTLAAAAALFAGAPYLFLDFHRFAEHLADIKRLESLGGHTGPVVVLSNFAGFGGPWLGGLAAAAGAVRMLREDRPRALWLLVPVAACLAMLSWSSEGGWSRYGLAVFPALALLAGAGVDALGARAGGAGAGVLLAALLAPGVFRSAQWDRVLRLPDTRTLSQRWIEGNVPLGKTILLDQESASPELRMSTDTVASLLERTRAAGHPRARYFQYMLDTHPGGGWRIYRVLRDFMDLHSYPEHVRFSQAAQPMLDVRDGLSAARAAGVDVVVLSSFGAQEGRSPELERFLAEVRREGRPLAAIEPVAGKATGPSIEIYSLR